MLWEYPEYHTKTKSDGETPVLELWDVRNHPIIAITPRFNLTQCDRTIYKSHLWVT